MKNSKLLTEYTDRELLKEFAEKTDEFNKLRLEEQDFIDEHDYRDLWDDDTEEEYQKIVGKTLTLWAEIDEIIAFVRGLR